MGFFLFARRYSGNNDCSLFLRVLRCFTSPGSPPTTRLSPSPLDSPTFAGVGFPIQTSTDHSLVGSSPWLIAAARVFLRLLKPRHPPYALISLTSLFRYSRSRRSDSGDLDQGPVKAIEHKQLKFFSFQRWLRDLLVELIGFEPTTSSLQSWRSST